MNHIEYKTKRKWTNFIYGMYMNRPSTRTPLIPAEAKGHLGKRWRSKVRFENTLSQEGKPEKISHLACRGTVSCPSILYIFVEVNGHLGPTEVAQQNMSDSEKNYHNEIMKTTILLCILLHRTTPGQLSLNLKFEFDTLGAS